MNKESNGITRRSFLGAATLLGGAAMASLTGCGNPKASAEEAAAPAPVAATTPDWLGEAPEIAESDIAETRHCDLLIVGAGNSGMSAAATAAELGADFIICEQDKEVQRTRHWIGAIDSPVQKAQGVTVDKQRLMNELARYASFKCDQSVIKTWMDESGAMMEWVIPLMEAEGAECILDADMETEGTGGTDYYVPAIQHMFYTDGKWMKGTHRNEMFEKHINDLGYEVTYRHKLVKLEREENGGRVTGALFETPEGYVRINAAKAVQLCTGGYAGNREMVQALSPIVDECVTSANYSTSCQGGGIKAALWVGAARDTEGAPMIFDRGAVAPGVDAGYSDPDSGEDFPCEMFQTNIGSQPFMKVNRRGKRFANESTPYDFICHAASRQPGGVWCQVFDKNFADDIMRFHTVGCSRQIQDSIKGGTTDPDALFKGELAAGIMQRADTLEQLADQLGFEGVDKEAFLAEVAHYNELYAAQDDPDFGKEPYRLSAIAEPPFYGYWSGGNLLTTVDGLRINKDTQVLDENAQVIEGLYATGDCSGSIFAGNYPEYIIGCAVGRSITFGRHAVKHVFGK